VPALRNLWGADLVSLISNDAGSGGHGFIPILNGDQNDTLAFTAIDQNSIDKSNLTIAHEIGHNLGAGHERDNPTQPAPGIYPYSYGYRFQGADGLIYHDIMSYDPGLTIPYYANPSVTYAGANEGKPNSDPQSADLATTFTLTAPTIAAYRPTAVADTVAPSASITSLTPAGNVLTFTVRYVDDSAVDSSTLGSNDVYVQTPEGFRLAAELLNIDGAGNAFAKTATYRMTLPASNPPLSSLRFFVRAGEVKDVNGNAIPAGEIPTNATDLAGWDFRLARGLGTLAPVQVMSDALGQGDFDDIYKFNVATRSTVNVALTGLTGAADFYFVQDKNHNGLYDPTANGDPANEYLGGSFNTNATDRDFTITLDPGTYYLWTFLQTQVSTAATPYTITIESYTADAIPPTATIDATDLTASGATYQDFAVTYTDDHAMDGVSARYDGAMDIHVALDNGFSYDTYWYPDPNLNPANPQNAPSLTILFRIFGPQGGYTSNDNGVYTLTPRLASRAKDAAGNPVPATAIGSYRVAIGTSDTTRPTASTTPAPILVPGAAYYDFTVAYADNRALDSASINAHNLLVSGPSGFSQHPMLQSLGPVSAGGSTRIATYRIAAPGGTWGSEDNGPYMIALASGQVKDTAGNFATAQILRTLNVHVPYPGDATGDDAVDFNDLVALAQNYNAYGKGVRTGDFNFDGISDFNDLVLLAQRYNTTLPPPVFAAMPAARIELAPVVAAPLPPAAKPKVAVKKVTPVFAVEPIRPPAAVKRPKPRVAGH
jgi:hypothetical protein